MKRVLLIVIAIVLSTSLFSQDLRGKVYLNNFKFSKGVESSISKTIQDLVILNISSMTSVVYTNELDSAGYLLNIQIDSVTTLQNIGKDSSKHYTSKINYQIMIKDVKKDEIYNSTSSVNFIPKDIVKYPSCSVIPETLFYKETPQEAIETCAKGRLSNEIKNFIENNILIPARITIIKKRSGYMKSLCNVNLGSANIKKGHNYVEVISTRSITGKTMRTLQMKLRINEVTGEHSAICKIDEKDIDHINKIVKIYGSDNIYLKLSDRKGGIIM